MHTPLSASAMVQFEPATVPKLRLSTDVFGHPTPYQPIQTQKMPLDTMANSGVSPKIGSPTGENNKADFAQGRIPGYSGHLPGVISNNPSGKSFGYITRMDHDELDMGSPLGFAHAASPGPWTSMYRRHYTQGTEDGPRPEAFRPPLTARDPSMTKNEDRILQAKFKPRSSRRVEMRTKPAWMIESGWITSRTNRLARPEEDTTDHPCSPEGRRPNRQAADWQVCASYLQSLGFAQSFNADLDKIFSGCDPNRGFAAGEPYETPKGWLGFGLQVAEKDVQKNIFQHWHTVYYPCPAEYLPTILTTRECVIPGDKLIDGTVTKTCFLTMRDGVEKRDPHTPRKLGATTRVCTTPSILYAHLKLNAMTRNGGFTFHQGRRLTFVLQCKQMGGALMVGGYQRAAEQIGWTESKPKGSRISPIFQNEDLENYSMRKSSVVPYRVLVKVEDAVFTPAWTSTGDPLMVPAQTQKDKKWSRTMAPAYASQTLLGLKGPFAEYSDATMHKTKREGGYECPKPSAPYLTFPEKGPIRDRTVDPWLRAKTQPMEPEALVKPSRGWVEGFLPPSFKNPGRNKGRCVRGIMAEMKEKFSANSNSLSKLFKNLAHTGDGEMRISDLGVILVRLNIIENFEEPILQELWETLDSDGSGSVSPDEFAGKFGLLGGAEAVMDVLKTKIGARFFKIGQAFCSVDQDKSGSIDKREFLKLLKDFNLMDGFPKGSDEEIWDMLDRDGSGALSYDEFVEKFSGGHDIQISYGPESGTRVIARKHFHKQGSKSEKVAAICDEGTACYAQQDWNKAEACYRKALAIDPEHVVTICCLSFLLLSHKKDVMGARGLMQRAIEINPHHPYVVWQKELHC